MVARMSSTGHATNRAAVSYGSSLTYSLLIQSIHLNALNWKHTKQAFILALSQLQSS